MLVLALDTTTRGGSSALLRDGAVLDCEMGDASRPHGERLPGDLLRLLDRQHLKVRDIELFAVAVGPGSLTGLRIGIATMQGLALANSRRIAGVSTLDALNAAADGHMARTVGAWLDAQRGEVFSALYRGDELLEPASVGRPDETAARWAALSRAEPIVFAGDGALAYGQVIAHVLPDARILSDVPPLAPVIARLAEQAAARNETILPADIRPIYVRRSDVELARHRRATANQ
jgi:tRNA threonylcarbamoyladenosine biosynthesis protein TsaB